MEENKDLVAKPSSEIGEALGMSEEDLRQMAGGLEKEDVTIPRLCILQGLSPEVSDGKGKAGEFFIKGLERNLGSGPIELIPLLRSKSRIRWKNINEGGGILCTSPDAKVGGGDPGGDCASCKYSMWDEANVKEGEKPKPGCDLYQNVIVVLRKDEDWFPLALSGARTNLKGIKGLNTFLMFEMSKGRPIFSKSYVMQQLKKPAPGGGSFFNYSFVPGNENKMLPLEEQKKAMGLFNNLKTSKIVIEQDKEEGTPAKGTVSNEY